MLTRRPEELELWKSDLACFQEKTQVAAKKLEKSWHMYKEQDVGVCEPVHCLAAAPKKELSLCMYEESKDDLIVKDFKWRMQPRDK